jgi:hypothetical protein
MDTMARGDYDKQMLDDFAFAVVALRLRPDDYWAMSRGEYQACVTMWKRLKGINSEDTTEVDQTNLDNLSAIISARMGGSKESE